MKKGKFRSVSELTTIAYYLGVITIIIEFGLGFMYIFSENVVEQNFGILTMLEGSFALFGLYMIDLIYGNPVKLKPDNFKPLHRNTGFRTIIILFTLVMIQLVMQVVPITIREVDRAMAIMFAGPAEELIFRGFIISVFIILGKDTQKYKIWKDKEISPIEIFGILLSSMLFAVIHVNYYGDFRIIISVFFSGLALGFLYWWWRDLTACILAHFLFNIITVAQSFYLLTF